MKKLSARTSCMNSSKSGRLRVAVMWRVGALVLTALGLGSISEAASCAAASLVTKMTYDAGDNVATVTDPRGLVTTQATDGLGRRWQRVSPDTGTTNFVYDAYGRLASMTRANGVQTAYGYDGINRQISVSAGGSTQSFVYDSCTNGLGRLCTDGDAKGATSYSYTPEGWLAGKGFSVVVPGGSPVSYGLGYNYDFEGRLTAVSYPDGNKAIYTRTQGAVSSVTYVIGGSTVAGASAITYRPMDMGMTNWTSSNGLTNTLSYDTDGRLTGISVPATQSLTFAYDSANRLQQLNNGMYSSLSQTFSYDAQSQLSTVTSGADNESYAYDANGNRTSQTGTADTVSATSNQLLSSGSNVYGYDALGNTTTVAGVQRYYYDAFNRMVSAAGTSYYVNPEGQRLSKVSSTAATYFAPDSSNAMLAENAGAGWIDYVWLNGRLIGRLANGQAYAVNDDQVGRPESVTGPTQAVVWHAQNFPFTQVVTTSTIAMNLGFPGQYYDSETSAWNNGFRDYKSGLGRYLESDPIGLGGGVNTYAYVGGNPLNYTDPLGLWELPPLPQGLVNASAGFGDALSFGLTGFARHHLGIGGVDECSSGYSGGQMAGIVAGLVDGEGEAEAGAWVFGAFKSDAKWASQLEARGWTAEQVSEAIATGEQLPATNLVNPGNPATRFISPTTGQSVVQDTVTGEILHVGGPGFKY